MYGIPDAGQAFSMFMQGLHIKKAGMVQCEVDSAIYVKVSYSADGKVGGFRREVLWDRQNGPVIRSNNLSKLQMHHVKFIDRVFVNQHETRH